MTETLFFRERFTRPETIKLTGLTSSRLSYLDYQKVVVPQKIGSKKKPYVTYTILQILGIVMIDKIRMKNQIQIYRNVTAYFLETIQDSCLYKHLIVFNNKVFWDDNQFLILKGDIQAFFDDSVYKLKPLFVYVLKTPSDCLDYIYDQAEKTKIKLD